MAARKKSIPLRQKTGLAAAPTSGKFTSCLHYFHYEMSNKELAAVTKDYIKKNYSKDDAKAILANPEYNFHMHSSLTAAIHWLSLGNQLPDNYAHAPQALDELCQRLITEGNIILSEKAQEEELKNNKQVVVLTPQQRLVIKINETVMYDLDQLEDQWINGEKTELDLYRAFKLHGLKGQAVSYVKDVIEFWLAQYQDAYDKTCDQAVEAYKHIGKVELKRRIKCCENMLADLDKIKSAAKATRTTRVKKPKSVDKQIAKVKYKKEDTEFKLVSINPAQIVGANNLYTFNTKTRKLAYYFTDSVNGFEISGTSIKNFDPDNSTSITLRANKVDEVLPGVLKKTKKQIEKALGEIKTKPTTPNGRLNDDTILLRVL